MAKTHAAPSREILEAALVGLESQREKLEEQIAQVRSLLGHRVKQTTKATVSLVRAIGNGRRPLSPEARERIATAQKKRWAAFRRGKK